MHLSDLSHVFFRASGCNIWKFNKNMSWVSSSCERSTTAGKRLQKTCTEHPPPPQNFVQYCQYRWPNILSVFCWCQPILQLKYEIEILWSNIWIMLMKVSRNLALRMTFYWKKHRILVSLKLVSYWVVQKTSFKHIRGQSMGTLTDF